MRYILLFVFVVPLVGIMIPNAFAVNTKFKNIINFDKLEYD